MKKLFYLLPLVTALVLSLQPCKVQAESTEAQATARSAVEALTLESTPLFKQNGDDLTQIVLISLDLLDSHENVRIVLTCEDGCEIEQSFADVSSGKQSFEIEVTPVAEERNASARVFIDGTEYDVSGVLRPERHWKLFIMPSTHFDFGYTDIQPETMKVHRENLEKAIDWCAEYPDFVWNLEASIVAEDYLKNGSRPGEFIRLAREGRIGIHGFYGNPLTGISSGEELSRLIAVYDQLRHAHGIESRIATQNDVPTMVWTVPMILNEHGIKYLGHGQNRVRSGMHQEMDKTPFYWESPDGSRVLSWKVVGSYAQSQWLTGTDDTGDILQTRRGVIGTVRDFTRHGNYPYDAVLIYGAFGDNRQIKKSIAKIPDEWNRTYAYPKLILCRGSEFFEYVEDNFADLIPTLSACGGIYWEDGAGSSARETAITRVAKEELLTAEKLTALCSTWFQRGMAGQIAEAWKNIVLYDEHTWGANVSVEEPFAEQTIAQWAIKKSFADRGAELSRELLDKAMDRFAADIRAEEESVVVFNPSDWSRSERIIFTTPDGDTMSLVADNVPGLGYKVFPLSEARKETERKVSGEILDNQFYRIEFDQATGSVSSIYDKQLRRELLDTSTYGANDHLYVTNFYAEDSGLIVDRNSNASFEKIILPGRQVMRITADAPMTNSFASEVILFDKQKRIDFVNHMDKKANLEKESGYFAFPFAFENPSVRLEIPHGVMRPEIDQYGGACRDWYGVQHFLTVADDSAAVAWTAFDSPLVTLQDINREKFMHHIRIENGHVYAYVFNNLWFTNYRAAQEGPLTFRFSMTSDESICDLTAKRFGESVQSPMVSHIISGSRMARGQASQSFVEVDGDSVLVQALKPARFHRGTIIRLREMAGATETVRMMPTGIDFERAYLCNMAEDKISELTVHNGVLEVPCKALGLTTILLER